MTLNRRHVFASLLTVVGFGCAVVWFGTFAGTVFALVTGVGAGLFWWAVER